MKNLKQFLNKYRGKTALTLLLLLGQVVGTLLIPYLIADVVDNGILKGDMDAILKTGIWMFSAALITTAASVAGCYFCADLAALFGHDMRVRIFKKSQELSISQFDSIGVSSMITRTTSDISNIQQTMGMTLQLIVPAPFITLAALIMTAKVNGYLALTLASFILLFIALSWAILKKSIHLTQKLQKKLDRINQVIREAITGIRVIRAFGNENHEEQRASGAFSSYADNCIRLNKLFAVLNPAVWMVIGLTMAVIIWMGGYFSLQGTMAIGEITAVTEYAIMALSYLIMAATSCVMLPRMKACLDRLEEVMSITPAISDTVLSHLDKDEKDAVTFEHVSFYYEGGEEPVISDLSFCCRPGQTTAIIGSTGSGKSTIANLMLRLHDVSAGSIRLGSTDIRDLPQKDLRDAIGYVPQKAFLFSGTIEDNLFMGNEEATEPELKRAMSIAQAEDFVSALEHGIHAPVSQGGSNFSGGQKQRLAIARALVKKASVYLFDDSFSALDMKTDRAVRQALKQHVTSAVKIIIAQRISTIIDADQILVLDEGRLVGSGTHEALMRQCSVYQDIAKSQFNSKEG